MMVFYPIGYFGSKSPSFSTEMPLVLLNSSLQIIKSRKDDAE